MTPLFITVPGWNSRGWYMHHFNRYADPRGVPIFNYGYGWILFKTLRNGGIVQRLVDTVEFLGKNDRKRPIIGIGHSNGCEILWRAARRCHRITGLVCINAALDADAMFPATLDFVHNWYSPSDWVVRLAGWIPFNNWGDLGARRYQGVSSMVQDFDKEHDFELSSSSHSDVFRSEALRGYFLPRILNTALGAQAHAGRYG